MAYKEMEDKDERDNEVDLHEESLLIPENVIDQASQRLFLVSIFVLIQCWKIYDILLIRADSFSTHMALDSGSTVHQSFTSLNNYTFVLKYALIDGLFVWLLPVLNVPYLRFSPLVSFLLTIAATAFTFLLASDSAIPLLSGGLVPIWNFLFRSKELTIVGDSVNPQVVNDMNAHFKGRYTIRYLPESSVRLNPFHYGNACLESSSNDYSTFPSTINLPIEFNTTTEIGFMQIKRTSPSNQFTYLDFSARDVRKLLSKDYSHLSAKPGYISKDSRVFYLEIPIKSPGTYKISKVTDKDGAVIRSYKSEFSIAHCPTSRFVYPGLESEYSSFKCVGNDWQDIDWSLPLLESYGVLPLTVKIAANVGDRRVSEFNATITETTADEGANALTNAVKLTRNALEQQFLKNPSRFVKQAPGQVHFHLLSVTDYLGNTRRYNPSSADRDVSYSLELKKSPSLSLRDTNPQSPLLINASKRIHIETRDAISFPLKVTLRYENSTLEEATTLNYEIKDQGEFSKGIQIWSSGKYTLLGATDKFCSCDIDAKPVQITTPHPPAVVIRGSPISDKCIGDIGLQFDTAFTGAAPFKLSYQVFKNHSGTLRPVLNERGSAIHTITSSNEALAFSYKPQREGGYIVVFKELRDKFYQSYPVQIDESVNTFSIYSKQRSTYSLFSRDSSKVVNLCKGEQVDVPVTFSGNAPYSFVYQIVDKSSGKIIEHKRIEKLSESHFSVRTPEFVHGGSFALKLLEVKDSLECPVESAGEESVSIFAREYVPEVSMAQQQTLQIVEGDSVQIPFSYKHTTASPVKRLGLAVQDLWNSDDIKNISISATSSISVDKEGIYKLVSFKDEQCPGVVSHPDRWVKVLYHPKPNLTIVADEKDIIKQYSNGQQSLHLTSVCQNADLIVKPVFEGTKPFSARHKVKYPDGKTFDGVFSMPGNSIHLPTDKAGEYQHVFSDVYDGLYTERVMSKLHHECMPSSIRYSVLPNPNLKIVKGKSHLQICESRINDPRNIDIQIPVELQGKAPFVVKGSIRHSDSDASEQFTLHDVSGSEINFVNVDMSKSSLKDVLSIGDHLIVFEEIIDANGCRVSQLSSQNSVTVSVTKVPEITKDSVKPYYCVGDHVSYKLQGISPFVVYYEFNDQVRKAEVGHSFQRLAAKPGELSIIALEDSSVSRCRVNYTTIPDAFEKLKLQIHQVPSVEISHGDTIIENLHEGDQAEIVFKFSGVPPFEVTYVRTLDDDGNSKRRQGPREARRQKRVVDTKTIKDIWDFEITEIVSQEGTYDAIRVKDAYCEAKRDVNELL